MMFYTGEFCETVRSYIHFHLYQTVLTTTLLEDLRALCMSLNIYRRKNGPNKSCIVV
jgi:hypothetical protein